MVGVLGAAMKRWIASLRRWWHSRAEVRISFPPGYPPVVVTVDVVQDGGLYTVMIGSTTITIRARWWDTRASMARKLRQAIGAVIV
jgi:hypothetical protein